MVEGVAKDPRRGARPFVGRQQLHDSPPPRTAPGNADSARREPGRIPSLPVPDGFARVLCEAADSAGGLQPPHARAPAKPSDRYAGRCEVRADTGSGPDSMEPAAWARRHSEVDPPGSHSRERGRLRLRIEARGHGAPRLARRELARGVESRRPAVTIRHPAHRGRLYPQAAIPRGGPPEVWTA